MRRPSPLPPAGRAPSAADAAVSPAASAPVAGDAAQRSADPAAAAQSASTATATAVKESTDRQPHGDADRSGDPIGVAGARRPAGLAGAPDADASETTAAR